MLRLLNPFRFRFSQQKINTIKNNNLIFDLSNWQMNVYFFHPQLVRKTLYNYEIRKNSTVMAFSFLPKMMGTENDVSWEGRKSITFKFINLGQFLLFKPGSGSKQIIKNINSYYTKDQSKVQSTQIFEMQDLTQQKQILLSMKLLKLRTKKGEQNADFVQDFQLTEKIKLQDFVLLRNIVKASLPDISGLRLQMEVDRQKIMKNLHKDDNLKQNLDSLTQEYDNKPV